MKFRFMIAAVLVSLTTVHAADEVRPANPETAFNTAKMVWTAGDWEKTLRAVDNLRRWFPRSPYEASAALLAAQAALKGRMLGRAMEEAQSLVVRFPDSGLLDEARWVMVECSILAERWGEAQDRLNYLIAFASKEDTKRAARLRLEELRAYFEYKREREIQPDTASKDRAKVVLLLPMSGVDREVAEAFLSGFQHRWDRPPFSEPVIWDTEGDPVRAARLVKRAAEEGAWVIVGGLSAAESAACASAAEVAGIPFLTTWCSSEGLTTLGRNVFQGRPDVNRIGRELADYAVTKLGLGRFAMLSPLSGEGRSLAAAFKSELNDLGVTVVAEDVYYPGTEDFSSQFKRLRSIGLKLAFDDSLRVQFRNFGVIPGPEGAQAAERSKLQAAEISPETGDTVWTLSQDLLDQMWSSAHDKVRRRMMDTGRDMDSLEIPVTTFDGVLLIAEPGKLEMLAPQFARANLRARPLGGENWGDRESLRKVRSYIDKILFADPFGAEVSEERAALFSKLPSDAGFTQRQALLAGERAARMIEFAVRRAAGPQSARQALSQIRDLKTCSGEVTLLKEERVDRRVGLMEFGGGEFILKQ